MNKIAIFNIFILLIMMFFSPYDSESLKIEQIISKKTNQNSEESILQDALLSLLFPYIDKAIENYYGIPRQYNSAKILKIERIDQSEYHFDVTLQVRTFVGAHNPPYGLETLTIRKDYTGINVIKYEHLDLPIQKNSL